MLKKMGIEEGTFLAAATAALYAFCYFYEVGYLSYYGIPASFISLGISSIIPAILESSIYIILIILWFIFCLSGANNKSYSVRVFSYLCFIIWMYLAGYFLTKGIAFILFSILSIIFYTLVRKTLYYFEEKSRTMRILSYIWYRKLLVSKKKNESNFTWEAVQKICVVLLAVGSPLFLAYSAGKSSATYQVNHSLIKHSDYGDSTLIRIYGDTVLLNPINLGDENKTYYVTNLPGISGSKIMPIKNSTKPTKEQDL